ncbi:MAG: hypothetical protein ACLRJV_15015 [Eubacteriales bacterium]
MPSSIPRICGGSGDPHPHGNPTHPSTGETYEVEVTYEWRILNVNLTAKSFTDVIAARMDTEQAQLFNILMMTKGNRQYVSNVFGDTNWLPYVTSYYGYRVHPISGEKNYHKAVDIDAPGHGDPGRT